MRIDDVLTMVGDRIIGRSTDGFLYFTRPTNADPFQALKKATLEPEAQGWHLWNIRRDEDLDEVADQLRQDARQKYAWPVRAMS